MGGLLCQWHVLAQEWQQYNEEYTVLFPKYNGQFLPTRKLFVEMMSEYLTARTLTATPLVCECPASRAD